MEPVELSSLAWKLMVSLVAAEAGEERRRRKSSTIPKVIAMGFSTAFRFFIKRSSLNRSFWYIFLLFGSFKAFV
jgi:hypothetical protein